MKALYQVFCALVLILQIFNDQIFFDLIYADIWCIHHLHHALVASLISLLILELFHPQWAYLDSFGVGYKAYDPPELVIILVFILVDHLILGTLLVLEWGVECDEVNCIRRQLFLLLILEVDICDFFLNFWYHLGQDWLAHYKKSYFEIKTYLN